MSASPFLCQPWNNLLGGKSILQMLLWEHQLTTSDFQLCILLLSNIDMFIRHLPLRQTAVHDKKHNFTKVEQIKVTN